MVSESTHHDVGARKNRRQRQGATCRWNVELLEREVLTEAP